MESIKPTHSWDKNNNWLEEIAFLKSIIVKTELVETTKWGGIVYVLNGKNVLGIGGFKNYFTIWFFNGFLLQDSKKVLVNAQEGLTKSLRQWRFSSIEEVDETSVLAYALEAIANEKAGKKNKRQKKEVIVSKLLQEEFNADRILAQAFEKFSSSKKYEFLEYIETAKREESKRARILKIKPMILQQIGLNDKYR